MTVPPATQPPENDHPGNIIPCLRYRDAPAMIEWLCRHFGFQKQLVVPGGDGTVAHAQLCLPNSGARGTRTAQTRRSGTPARIRQPKSAPSPLLTSPRSLPPARDRFPALGRG